MAMSWAFVHCRNTPPTTLLPAIISSRAHWNAPRFQRTKLKPTRPISTAANASRFSAAQTAMKNSPASRMVPAKVNMMIETPAISDRTRYAALKATVESASNRRRSASSALQALITRTAPRTSWARDVRSELVSRAVSERDRTRRENHRPQRIAIPAMVNPIKPRMGSRAAMKAIVVAYVVACVRTETSMPTMAVTCALSW